jgi:serine/threonine-protein kinase
LLEEIARGGMGIVYKARQRSLDRIVAIKMLLFGDQSGKDLAQRFRAEAAAAASLQHPNIVAIHEVSAHEGQPFFVMDFIEGQSLARLAAGQPLPASAAARYVKIIAEAIHYAHERGVVHRDLKPSNVLIDSTDQPRVTDFGLAKRVKDDSDLTATGQVLGSPNYMPPEQAAARHGEVGPHSDVYSLGALLYHLLTGRPPFLAETIQETLIQALEYEPVPPTLLNRTVPRDLEAVCLKCLEKSTTRRYPTSHALADELERFQNGELVQASKDRAGSRLMRLLVQETRHPEILRQWCHIWMWQSVQLFLLFLLTNMLILREVRAIWAFVALWIPGTAWILAVVWWKRFRRGPPLTPIERKMSAIWWMFAGAFFLTAGINQLMGLQLTRVLPFVALEFGLAFGCMALMLGGEFYVTAVLCGLLALALVRLSEAAAVLIGTTIGVGLFVPAWRYSQRLSVVPDHLPSEAATPKRTT